MLILYGEMDAHFMDAEKKKRKDSLCCLIDASECVCPRLCACVCV